MNLNSFSIHSWKAKPVSLIDGDYYISLDITPAAYPPESFDIYQYAKNGKKPNGNLLVKAKSLKVW